MLAEYCIVLVYFFACRRWSYSRYMVLGGSSLPQPIITIFGGSHFDQTDEYAKQAHELARRFANEGVSVFTGGGSGIMQAASCGAIASGKGKGRLWGLA